MKPKVFKLTTSLLDPGSQVPYVLIVPVSVPLPDYIKPEESELDAEASTLIQNLLSR